MCAFATPTRLLAVLASLVLVACGRDVTGPEPSSDESCTTFITNEDGANFVELCELAVPVRHVRIENLRAPATHASSQIVFGFDAPPISPTQDLIADQFRVLFYGGGHPQPAAAVQASFGPVAATLDGDASLIRRGATVCFDLHDGSTQTAPAFVLWIDRERGADCGNPSTLTAQTAYGARAHWNGATGPVDKDARLYFRQSGGSGALPAITLLADPALETGAIAAGTSCETTWAQNTEWQELCSPAIGIARHVRIEGVQSLANNSYFHTVLGQVPNPTGNPAPSPGKLIVTGGRSNSGASWTWFRFDDGTTTQFIYSTDAAAPLYTQGPSTICFDIGSNAEGSGRFLFWATGANESDCADPSSLTPGRALYNSITDPSTGGIWDAPYAEGMLNFVKTSNGNVSLVGVVVSSEPAAL